MTNRALEDALSQASATEYGVAKLAADGATTAGLVVQASDGRLAAVATVGANLAAHLADPLGAHAASAIAYTAGGDIVGSNVQTAIEDVSGDLATHVADTTAAHAAAAIGFTPVGTVAATTVQAAIAEVAADVAAAGAHTIQANSTPLAQRGNLNFVPGASGITVTDDAANNQTDVDFTAVGANLAAHLADTTAAHGAAAIAFTPVGTIAATDVQAAIAEVASEGLANPTTTRGDLIARGAAAIGRLAVGTAGQRLRSDGTDPAWGDEFATLTFVIDGGGAVPTVGVKGDLEVPDDYTIVRATALADQTGSIVVDIWKATYAFYPPTDPGSITAAAPVTIASATKSQDSGLTGWGVTLAAGDILRFNVDSVSALTRVAVCLRCRKRA